ncbi:MAG: hypothetical protein NT027_04610 [Proteobacteria bacterium]|nr:hypothetical protein [Pseudomonadota bacterium]
MDFGSYLFVGAVFLYPLILMALMFAFHLMQKKDQSDLEEIRRSIAFPLSVKVNSRKLKWAVFGLPLALIFLALFPTAIYFIDPSAFKTVAIGYVFVAILFVILNGNGQYTLIESIDVENGTIHFNYKNPANGQSDQCSIQSQDCKEIYMYHRRNSGQVLEISLHDNFVSAHRKKLKDSPFKLKNHNLIPVPIVIFSSVENFQTFKLIDIM